MTRNHRNTASGATHILTSMELSGSKTQKFLTSKSRNNVQVVRPQWVFDSILARKRLSERSYAVIKPTTPSIANVFGAGSSSDATKKPTV